MKKSTIDSRYVIGKGKVNNVILEQAKENKSTVYGGQAIKARLPVFLSRKTEDYDVYSKQPKKSARQLEKKLDKKFGGDFFYVKEAEHKGTWKVMNRGASLKTKKDDRNVADYSKPERKVKSSKIKGVKYVRLSEVRKDKLKALEDKEVSFRHKKDKDDLHRIKTFNRMKRMF